MYSIWTQHLKTAEEKERFKNTLLGSKEVLSRLYDILEEKDKEQLRSELSISAYDNPNWAYRQAHLNGRSYVTASIKNLINLDHKD